MRLSYLPAKGHVPDKRMKSLDEILHLPFICLCLAWLLVLSCCLGTIKLITEEGWIELQRFPHLEKESVSHWVAEAEDKIFLGVFRHSLDDAVLHPQCMFMNAAVVNARATIWFIQKKGAALKNRKKKYKENEQLKNLHLLSLYQSCLMLYVLKQKFLFIRLNFLVRSKRADRFVFLEMDGCKQWM